MTLALLDARTQGVGAQLNLRDDGTLETLVTCRHGSILLAHGALLSPAQTRELWHQLGAALLHPDRAHWRPCPTWDNGCKCSPLFSCQRDAVAPDVPPKAGNVHTLRQTSAAAAVSAAQLEQVHAETSPSSPGDVHAKTATAPVLAIAQQPVTLGGLTYQPLPDDQNPFAPGDDPEAAPLTPDELRAMGVLV